MYRERAEGFIPTAISNTMNKATDFVGFEGYTGGIGGFKGDTRFRGWLTAISGHQHPSEQLYATINYARSANDVR